MANQLIEGEIPLQGTGFIVKPEGRYQPGEFKRLVNMEYGLDGNLVTRPPINPARSDIHNQMQWWMGILFDAPVAKTTDSQIIIQQGAANITIPMTGSTDPATHPLVVTNTMVGCVHYNDQVYWVSYMITNTNFLTIYVHKSNTGSPVTTSTGVPTLYTQYSHNAVVTIPAPGQTKETFRGCFIYKDRLWLITRSKIYFSKVGDPTTWAAPDGGSFSFPNQNVTDAVPLRNSIYIATDSNIQQLTYSSDPNTDSTLITINGQGTDSLAVYRDSVLFVSGDVLYSIQSSYVQKLRDLGLKLDYARSGAHTYLVVWEDRLIIQYRVAIGFSGPSITVREVHHNSWIFTTATAAEIYAGYTFTYVLNMITNCMWEFDFHDRLNLATDGDVNTQFGLVTEFIYNPYSTSAKIPALYFFTCCKESAALNKSRTYYILPTRYNIGSSNEGIETYDSAYDSSGTLHKYSKNVNIEIDSYVPDGNESNLKKFRSFILEGRLPEVDTSTAPDISFAFDGAAFTTPIRLVDTAEPARQPAVYRYPVNQRARSLTVKMYSEIVEQAGVDLPADFTDSMDFTISRLSVFWSYLGRLPVHRSSSVNV